MDQITTSTRAQQRIEESIKVFQGRVALSPAIEEQYKQLTRDNETFQKLYDDDLAKKRASEKQTAMELEQQGEQMRVLNPADLPSSPSFPNRLLFAGGGLAAGLGIGLDWPSGLNSAIPPSALSRTFSPYSSCRCCHRSPG